MKTKYVPKTYLELNDIERIWVRVGERFSGAIWPATTTLSFTFTAELLVVADADFLLRLKIRDIIDYVIIEQVIGETNAKGNDLNGFISVCLVEIDALAASLNGNNFRRIKRRIAKLVDILAGEVSGDNPFHPETK